MTKQIIKVFVLIFALVLVFALPMSAEEYLTGDMNGDGVVNSNDAIYLLRYTLKKEDYPLACNHNLITENESEATCTQAGLSRTYCSRCVYEKQDEIPAFGHNYVDGKCTNCGEPTYSKGLEFTSNGDGTCYVSGIGTCTDTDILIPEIAPNGDRVIGIGYRAFYYSHGLTSIFIPDSVISIRERAFSDCYSLTSVTIGDSVTSIGDKAFRECNSLTNVYITDIAAWCNISFGDYSANPLCNGGSLVLNNRLVKDIIIPDSITSIGNYAFYGCNSMESVTIPYSVTSIGSYAFYGCSSLTSITIPLSVTSIGWSAFYECDSLTGVYITDIVAWCNISFGNYSANPLSNANNIYLNGELVTNLVVPNSVTSIGSYAFYGCDCLTSITIPYSATSIGDYAFRGCTSLASVTIDGIVTSIGTSAFLNCEKLTSVTIGDSVTNIGIYAFELCDSLSSVTISNSVTSPEYAAFYPCENLTGMPIQDSVTSTGDYAFSVYTSPKSTVFEDTSTR